jgi:hypothetical protein
MSIKINRLEEGHNSYPLICRRPAETMSLQRRQTWYRWGTPACWSLVPRSIMFYLFEFCLKNMWNCSLTQHILSHSFYDWKLCHVLMLFRLLLAVLQRHVWMYCTSLDSNNTNNCYVWIIWYISLGSGIQLI